MVKKVEFDLNEFGKKITNSNFCEKVEKLDDLFKDVFIDRVGVKHSFFSVVLSKEEIISRLGSKLEISREKTSKLYVDNFIKFGLLGIWENPYNSREKRFDLGEGKLGVFINNDEAMKKFLKKNKIDFKNSIKYYLFYTPKTFKIMKTMYYLHNSYSNVLSKYDTRFMYHITEGVLGLLSTLEMSENIICFFEVNDDKDYLPKNKIEIDIKGKTHGFSLKVIEILSEFRLLNDENVKQVQKLISFISAYEDMGEKRS